MSNKSVGWQFFEDGQWWTGFDTNNHRKNTEEAGIPVREVYVKSDDQLQARVEELEFVLKGLLNEAHTSTKPLHSHSEWSIKAEKVLENK